MRRHVLVPLAIAPALPPRASTLHDLGGSTMGTSWSARVMAPGGARAALLEDLQRQLDLVVAQMSHWERDSNLSRFNSAPAGNWHRLPDEFFTVLSYALEVAEASGGAYDPCAGALVDAWGFGARQRYNEANFYAPLPAASAAIVARGDRQRMRLDAGSRRALQPGGVRIDLSSVAKGYAVDLLARCLEAQGLHHYLVEIGGELRGAGTKADGQPWWVALEGVPDAGGGAGQTTVALHGLAIATSGDYRRYFEHGGRRASHTLDPRTGTPIRNDVASVTVLHTECMAADALSTALSVLGPDEGLAFAESRHLAARFLLRQSGGLREVVSSAYQELLQ
ncbi:thiamine biosynthesis protein ApbE [Massilia violaceinigra]|uniref:FAD:protein FMN transferase n=1 Tax=Massilia violaceinigra TaxID=2045208 RepID=A0A2D2DM49_9BURK|nr:FAD:protein FMN transferase [Massilia violaceinigra]ATQ76049.1 thiamine biosynthesis protein ApbE [Massilia violaceinigra]